MKRGSHMHMASPLYKLNHKGMGMLKVTKEAGLGFLCMYIYNILSKNWMIISLERERERVKDKTKS